jgi:hypothetical protein
MLTKINWYGMTRYNFECIKILYYSYTGVNISQI